MAGDNNNLGSSQANLSNGGFTARVLLKDGIYTYIADAAPGTAVTAKRWSVSRVITDGSAAEGTTAWAGGSNSYTNAADDLTNLVYS